MSKKDGKFVVKVELVFSLVMGEVSDFGMSGVVDDVQKEDTSAQIPIRVLLSPIFF